MVQKELDYVRSVDNGEKDGGVYIDAFDAQDSQSQLTGWAKFVDGFKEQKDQDLGLDPNLTETERLAIKTANAPLNRRLKGRHLQMIAIGGSIGTGLFVGSGGALINGGPAGVLIAYFLIGTMMYCTVQSLGELAITFPVSGSFVTFNSRFIDPSWGFAMAWNYALQWLVVFPLELVAAAIVVQYWNKDINPAAFVAIFWAAIVVINFFGVKGYGEAEFAFSFIKVLAVCGYIILGIILVCGGGPVGGYVGGRYYQNPGAFSNGAKGVIVNFVSAAFAFAGTELVGLASAETKDPRKSLPSATKQVFWRITLFYIISLCLVGLLVPFDTPELQGTSSYDANASPFVISIERAGISGLPHVMNAVILIAVLSVGNSSVYASSRTLAALAASGQAPKFLGYIDRTGRPLYAIIVQCAFGLIAFITASNKSGEVFDWLLALSALSSIFTWGSINFCLIRFRMALKAQGRGTDEIAYTSQVGIIGAYWGFLLNFTVVCLQFWIAVWPLGASPDAETFFKTYLCVPIIMGFYCFHKIWKKNWRLYFRATEIDIDTGRRELDLDVLKQEIAEEKAYIRSKPFYYRIYNFFC